MNNAAVKYTTLTLQLVSVALLIALFEVGQNLSAYDNQLITSFFRAHEAIHEKNYGVAKVLLNKCIAKSPGFADAYLSRVMVNEKLGDFASAITDTSASIESQPSCGQVGRDHLAALYLLRARLYTQGDNSKLAMNDCQTAADIYSQVIAESPRQADAYLSRANAYEMMDKSDLASADRLIADSLRTLAMNNSYPNRHF